MKALVFKGNREIELRDFPDPIPGPGEVRIKLGRAAVCGTDVHLYLKPPDRVPRLPDGGVMIPGHEPAGWIDQMGPGVSGLSIGQPVLAAGVMGCGSCSFCRIGNHNACDEVLGLGYNRHGADATMLVVPAANAVPLLSGVSLDAATVLTCAGCTAYSTVRDTNLGDDDRLAIIGLGPVGLCLTILAKSMSIPTIGFDRLPQRLAMARDLGIDLAVDVSTDDPVKATLDWTGGTGAEVVAECVGLPETQSMALKLGRKCARIGMAGLGGDPLTIKLDREMIDRQLKVFGIASLSMRYLPNLIERTGRMRLPFEKLVTHRFPLERAAEAFAVMESGQSGKVVFEIADAP